ncbi:uncharacterized protein LOC9642781 [Selaginella moellendorffii]|uniref:uncharacterized protein LOC9642781 n=1 Tax=Selaginella moellendorffii TaxID=88036 RepID=UPI000D1C83E1|nr:uncharacterized protein LOC9642781 [Selaginella moellendorffii]|eukprot:XP_002971393.2 uncharacterized protein LOC9642781 [Selaginella moellendorffii]
MMPCVKALIDRPARCHCARISAIEQQKQPQPVLIHRLIDDAFKELDLELLRTKVKGARRRQHCNPMKASLMEPLTLPDWKDVFADPALPLTVDIGCGQGKFSLLLAKKNAGFKNYLGLDVRRMLVEKANVWAKELNLVNAHFLTANATVSFGSLLPTYSGRLELVCILCPDPHFKLRHRKRRIVQPALVNDIIRYTAVGGKIFLESDVEEVAVDMRNQFETHLGVITKLDEPSLQDTEDGWLLDNPLGVCSEREIAVLAQGGKMYRAIYQRR